MISKSLEGVFENTETGKETEDDDVDDEPAELRSGEVFQVVVVGHESEADTDNPADDRDGEDKSIGEIAPHGNRSVAIGDGDLDGTWSRGDASAGGFGLGGFRSFSG